MMAAITKRTILPFYHLTLDADSSRLQLLEDSLYKPSETERISLGLLR